MVLSPLTESPTENEVVLRLKGLPLYNSMRSFCSVKVNSSSVLSTSELQMWHSFP